MAYAEVTMHGVEKVQRFFISLPANLMNDVGNMEGEWLAWVQKNAKLRAPRASGQLADSITFRPTGEKGEWELTVDSPYGWFQEYGWTPNFLPAELSARVGYTIGDWMAIRGIAGQGITPSGQPHPFIQPAFDAGIAKLPAMMAEAAGRAVRR